MPRRYRFGKLEWPPPLLLASPQLLLLQKWQQSLFHVAPDGNRTVRGMVGCSVSARKVLGMQRLAVEAGARTADLQRAPLAAACKLPAHRHPAFPQMMSKWLAKHELNRRAMSDLARNARQLAAWHRHTQQHGERGAGAQAVDVCAEAACFTRLSEARPTQAWRDLPSSPLPFSSLPPPAAFCFVPVVAVEGVMDAMLQAVEADEAADGAAPASGSMANGVVAAAHGTAAAANGAAGQPAKQHGHVEGGHVLRAVAVKDEPMDAAGASALPAANGQAAEPEEQPENNNVVSCSGGLVHPKKQAAAAALEHQQQQQQQQQQPAAANGTALPKQPQAAAGRTNGAAAQAQVPTNGKTAGAGQLAKGMPSEGCLTGHTVEAAAAVQQQIASLQHALASASQQQLGEEAEAGQPSIGGPQALPLAAQGFPMEPAGGLLGRKRSFGELSQGSGEDVPPSSRPRHGENNGVEGGRQEGGSGWSSLGVCMRLIDNFVRQVYCCHAVLCRCCDLHPQTACRSRDPQMDCLLAGEAGGFSVAGVPAALLEGAWCRIYWPEEDAWSVVLRWGMLS